MKKDCYEKNREENNVNWHYIYSYKFELVFFYYHERHEFVEVIPEFNLVNLRTG